MKKRVMGMALMALVLAFEVCACSSDKSNADGANAVNGATVDGGGDAGPSGPPWYALAILVFGPDSTTTYVSVFNSLDLSSVDLNSAYEFAGTADIATLDGKLFINDGETPSIHRYAVGADGKLTEDGVVSFANLGLEDVGLRDNVFISSTKAYITEPTGQFAIWNPSTMKLLGEVQIPDNMNRDGMILDGSPAVARGNRLYKTYYWEDWTTYTFSAEQYVATFDTDTDTLIGMVPEQHCPNLGAVPQKDEEGNLYFSNWFYNVPGTLMKDAPQSCVLRIPKDADAIDPNWSLRFADVDGGHEGAQLSYVGEGKAIFAAFRQEDFTIKADTAPYEIPSSRNWETWGVDLTNPSTAQAISGMDRGVADQTVFKLDGRTFVLTPGDDWETTKAYEVNSDGTSRLAFSIDGWSRGFFKIR